MRYLVGGFAAVMALCTAVLAADKKSGDFKVGDQVIVDFGGEERAEVVDVIQNGWLMLKFKKNGVDVTSVFPPDRVKPIPKSGKKKKTAAADAEWRTWASKSGKFKIKAKFVELVEDQLTLQKEDGGTVKVALDKLSDDDRKVARQLAENSEDNPFESDEDSPFESDSDANGTEQRPLHL